MMYTSDFSDNLKKLAEDGYFLSKTKSCNAIDCVNFLIDEFNLDSVYHNKILNPDDKSKYAITLSKKYGSRAFPLHTDGAQWNIPPRFIILQGVHTCKNNTKTFLLDSNILKRIYSDFLKNAIFSLNGNGFNIYTTLLCMLHGKEIFRYNPVIMKNITGREYNDFLVFLNEISKIEIILSSENFLVIDNWRMLHSRGKLLDKTCKRVIERFELYATKAQSNS